MIEEEELDSTAWVIVLCVCVVIGMMFTTTNRLLAATSTDASANVCRESKADKESPSRVEIWFSQHREGSIR
jgi:hypothetical protein